MTEYNSMNIFQLQIAAAKHSLDPNGSKTDIMQRLESYDEKVELESINNALTLFYTDKMKDRAREGGGTFVQMPEDGLCFFHSVIHQLDYSWDMYLYNERSPDGKVARVARDQGKQIY